MKDDGLIVMVDASDGRAYLPAADWHIYETRLLGIIDALRVRVRRRDAVIAELRERLAIIDRRRG